MQIENHSSSPYPLWINKVQKSKFQKADVTKNMIYFLGKYFDDVASFGHQLNQLNIGMATCFLGGFIFTALGYEKIPENGFNDFDTGIYLFNFNPKKNLIDANLAIVIHQMVIQILKPNEYLFDPNLPFANYHIPLSSNYAKEYLDQQTYVDLTIYFQPVLNEEVDCTCSGDGLKLIPIWSNRRLGFKLTQSCHVDKYSSLRKTIDLLKQRKYMVSIKHAVKVRNGLWTYIRHKLLKKTYISVEDQFNDHSKLLEACSRPFFDRYLVVETLDKKLNKYVDSHFKKNQHLISPFFQELTISITKFAASHSLSEQYHALKLLERIEGCYKRCLNVYKSFDKDDLEIIKNQMSILEKIISQQNLQKTSLNTQNDYGRAALSIDDKENLSIQQDASFKEKLSEVWV